MQSLIRASFSTELVNWYVLKVLINPLTAKLPHLKLCLADAIHEWVKIMHIWQNEGQLFSNRADWCHIMASTCLKGGTECGNN